MKKFISGLLIGAVLMLSLGVIAAEIKYTAVKSVYSINLFGRLIIFDKPVVVIGGTQYVPVQKFSTAMNLTYKEDAKTKRIAIGKLPKSQLILFKNVSYYTEGDYTYISGEAENKDIIEHSPFIKVAFYDQEGKVMKTGTAAIAEIGAGETKVFDVIIIGIIPEGTPYNVQVSIIN